MKFNGKRKLILWTLCWLAEVFNSWAQRSDSIDCLNDEFVTSIFNEPIELTKRGIIKIYENVTINELLATTNNEFEHNYIDARLENSNANDTKNLLLFTTEHFENYAREQTATRISLKINLGCGREKERVVPLKEGNYFSPQFAKTNYELIVPTPIFAGFDLTAFLEITARDDDLTRNQVNFTSNDSLPNYIRVDTKNATSSADKKTYFAALILERILLELPQPIEFEIVATDSGDPRRSSTAHIKISSDPKRSLPVKPKFVQTLYKGYINVDFIMEPIRMQLSNGTYSSEVSFFLDETDAEDFYVQDNKNGSIEIVWSPSDMNRSEILEHGLWEWDVVAEHESLQEFGVAHVLIEMADIKNNFHFVSSYYEGHIDEAAKLHLTTIIFNPYMYQPDMKFTLRNSYDFIYFSRQNFSIQLQLNESFSWQSVEGMSFIRLTLAATWEHFSALANIIINIPQAKTTTSKQLLQFEKPLYVGQLKAAYDLALETIVLKAEVSHLQEIEFKLLGEESDKFYLIQNGTHINIGRVLGNPSPANIKENSSILLVLEANYHDLQTFASVVINLPAAKTGMETRIFLTPLVMGHLIVLNNSQLLSLAPISVADDFELEFKDLKLHLSGENSVNFEVRKNLLYNKIDIALKTSLSAAILATKQLLNLTLQASTVGEHAINGTLLVLIELPIKECPAPLMTTPDPPQFSNTNYVFTVYTNQTGILGIVSAFSRDSNNTLHYSLTVPNDLLAQRLSINPFSGELFLYGTIEEGNYLFNITAENIATGARAVARALLKVQQREECKLFEGIAVEKTLMILHVDEEKPNYGLLNMTFNENCSFQIENMWPNDKEYVNINFLFHMLDAIAIDREDEVFANMSEPHIKVKLKLICNAESDHTDLTIDVTMPDNSRTSQIAFTEDIPFSADVMWLYLIIDDINDNPPEFKIPEGPIFLGYPSGHDDLSVYPEYLMQIEASDRDVGYNAHILYAIKDNSHFVIEPKTGRIYPKGEALQKDKQTELIVMAIDQNGNGLIARTVVVVKGLSSDFYSLLTFEEAFAKTRQQAENSLSQKFGYDINILKMSYVPQGGQARSGGVQQNFSCKAWIYAYKNQQLVTCKEIEGQILAENPHVNGLNIESYNEAAAIHSPPHQPSNQGYLIAVVLLSLLSCSFLVFIIWRFCYQTTTTTGSAGQTSSALAATRNGNGRQLPSINAQCSHGAANLRDCSECNNNRDNNHVKFSDLVENGIEDESPPRRKCN